MIARPLCRALVRPLVGQLRGCDEAVPLPSPRHPENYQSASLILDFLTPYCATQDAGETRYPLPLVLNPFALPLPLVA